MNWKDEVQIKLKRKNQILFSKESKYLQDLMLLIQNQEHRTLALWAFELARESIATLAKKYPWERRPQEALEAAQDWAAGTIKMQLAQQKILNCHALAKELDCKEDIATCHAIGQACAVVHTPGHAIGYPLYDLTSIVLRLGIENCSEAIEARKQTYIDKLLYWNMHMEDYKGNWAAFMLK